MNAEQELNHALFALVNRDTPWRFVQEKGMERFMKALEKYVDERVKNALEDLSPTLLGL
jgi:hypothetical protein